MIFCAWDHRIGPIYRRRSQCDVKNPSDSVFEAAVHKLRSAVHISRLQLVRNPIFLLLNHFHGFGAFWNSLILPILLAFVTSLQQVMPPILNLRKFSLFHRYVGSRHQNHRSWSVETIHTRSFTKGNLALSTWENSKSLSRSFLRMIAENQNFPQMTRIWIESWYLRSRINLWC